MNSPFLYIFFSQCVEDSYDIPRSHQMPYYNLNESNSISPTMIDRNQITASTPNLSDVVTSTIPKRSHFYSNAAPSKMDGNVFRYDFVEQVRHISCFNARRLLVNFAQFCELNFLGECASCRQRFETKGCRMQTD